MVSEFNFKAASDRLPPQNIEAEELILGGILLDPEAINRVTELLRSEMFSITAHQQIYKAATELHGRGMPTDLMSVTTWLSDRGALTAIGGQSKLAQLVDRTVSAVNIDQYAKLVVDKYLRRTLIQAGNQVADLGYDTATELPVIMDRAEQTIFSVTQSRPQQGLIPIADTLIHAFQDIQSRNQGAVMPGLTCGFYDLDAMTGGFQRSDLIVIAGRPSMGKCLTADSIILQADGSLSTIAEIYHQRQADLLTLGNDWKFHITQPSAFVDDGIKPAFRVTTRLGRVVETTMAHPYLTVGGWKPLGELKPGDKIAVPRKLEVFGTKTIRACEVELIAYLIGNGCLTDGAPEFTNIHPQIQEDFTRAIADFSPELSVRIETRKERSPVLHAATTQGRKNPLTAWLQDIGLWGKKAGEKSIPAFLFKLERSLVSRFLNRLFATDGWACVLASGQSQLGYSTVSENLARQVQHLLLRFGIIAALKKRSVKHKDTRRQAWQLDITNSDSIKTFISEIGIFGKENALSKVQQALTGKRYQTNRDLIPVEIWQQIAAAKGSEAWGALARRAGIKGHSNIHVGKRALSRERLWTLATVLENLPLQQLATSDIYWDEIVSIEAVGCKQVYDLTVPETHNFVANDICVHNTAISVSIAHKIAATHKQPVAIFSLEMSKEQLVQRLLSGEAGIESNRLRSGRISQNEWEQLSRAIGSLSELPIFIDDTSNITVTEMRSQSRRLMAEQGGAMGLILIDYLQLMEGANPDNRVQELSRITRSLKGLARELNVPVIALSQLSRGVEARTNKRPMLSDLRESGCLAGESLVTLADSGVQVPIRELVGKSGFAVWALNEATMQLEKAMVSYAFATGVKPVFQLKTRLGRSIRATGNHQFLTIRGWKRLDELQAGDRLALPRWLPSPSRQMQERLAVARCGTDLYQQNISRDSRSAIASASRAARLAVAVKSQELERLANSDVYWDEIVSIEADGEEEVYDLTVPVFHNFIANNIVVHNSIEQDADIVIMLYRDEYYSPDTPDRGIAEIIIAKHRNGPTGTVKLLFDPQFTRFRNMAMPNRP